MRRILVLFAFLSPIFLHAELPPSAYEGMQKAAGEALAIEVLRVDVEPGDKGSQKVQIMALVNSVSRSEAGLKEGDLITLTYSVASREKGWAGPGEIPILEEKDKTVAYLKKDPSADIYHPAAGTMSFRNF